MTTHDDRNAPESATAQTAATSPAVAQPAVPQPRDASEHIAPEPGMITHAGGPGHAYPRTAPGVPLSAFAFAFAVTMLGLVETGILSSAANDLFMATCFGIGAVGLLVGGLWEYRAGELFGGTFGVGYAGFLFSTALILKFFSGPMIAAAGLANFDHAFAAWLILWALFTMVFATSALAIAWPVVAPFTLAVITLIVLAVADLGVTASWVPDVTRAGGWVALVDGLAAGYVGGALVLNTSLGKEILPFPATNLFKSS